MSNGVSKSRTLPHIIAVPSDYQCVEDQMRYSSDAIPVDSLADLPGALPLIVPALGSKLDSGILLDRVDGLFVPGALSNVHPSRYGRNASAEDGPFDERRDCTAMPLIHKAIQKGVPTLMVCRGIQELNVAFGGSLRKERVHRHGTPKRARNERERYRLRHFINVIPGGILHSIVKTERIKVNSLHSLLLDAVTS